DRARHQRDARARDERAREIRVRREIAIPLRREAAQRKRRDVGVVEREDQQDRNRRVEERHQAEEEDPQQAPAVPRESDVHYAGSRTRVNRAKKSVSTVTTPSRKSARTEPVSQSGKPVENRSAIWLPYMYPDVPPTSEGVTNSPTVGMKTKKNPAATPGRLSGRVTRRNACQRLAPRSHAASSRRRSRVSSETKIGSATKGTH